MSEKKLKLEPCTLEEATHVEMGGLVYKLGQDEFTSEHQVLKYNDYNIEVHKGTYSGNIIHVNAFPLLGIKPMRESKREPRECMALMIIAQRNGKDVVALLPSDDFELGMTVRCVEILEDEK